MVGSMPACGTSRPRGHARSDRRLPQSGRRRGGAISTDLSPSTWAMACSSISATLRLDEHDAEQAVRAGLAILDAVGTLKAASDVPLQARVGIATGLVVVGEQPGTGDTRQRVAIGETPDLAAQLQAAASPGEVVIAASTRRLVGRMFDCRALGADRDEGAAATGGGVAGARRGGRRQPVRGAARGRAVPARWPAGGDRAAAAPLGSGQARRGPGRAALRRARHRQVAHRRKPAGQARGRAAYAPSLFLLSPPYAQRALPVHRAARAGRELRAGQQRRSKARQAGGPAQADGEKSATRCGAHRRAAGGAGGRALPGIGGQPAAEAGDDAHRAARPARRRCGAEPRPDRVRGRPLDRSDIARSARSNGCPRRQPAGAAGRHGPAGVPADLGRPAACDDAALEPPWPSRQRRHHWRRHQGQGAARRRRRAGPCAHRWRAAVHRGADEHAARERAAARDGGPLRARRTAAAARHTDDAAGLAGGPPRPAWPRSRMWRRSAPRSDGSSPTS